MSAQESRLRVDTRWDGTHGIGRYAREVVSRLATTWQPLTAAGSPSSPREALRRDHSLTRSDLVYSPGYNSSRASRARQLVTVHDLIHLEVGGPKGALYRSYYDLVLKPVVKATGSVLTVSETSAMAIRKWLRDDRIDVVNAGIGISEAFVPDGVAFQARRPYFLYVGNLRSHKNTDVIFRSIVGSDADVRMLIPKPEVDLAMARARSVGVTDQVHILSGIDDARLASLYRGAAGTFMPSLREGFGLPALESVMVGTPVLFWGGCTSVAEVVGDRGVSIESAESIPEWASAVRHLLASPTRVETPEPSSYDWGRTAAVVSGQIAAQLS